MSLDGVIDAPDVTREAQPYFAGDEEHDRYQKERLDLTTHLGLADVKRFKSGTVVLEYTPRE